MFVGFNGDVNSLARAGKDWYIVKPYVRIVWNDNLTGGIVGLELLFERTVRGYVEN